MSGLERPHVPKRVASACSTPQKTYKLTPKPGEVYYFIIIIILNSQIYQCQKEIKDNHCHFFLLYLYIVIFTIFRKVKLQQLSQIHQSQIIEMLMILY